MPNYFVDETIRVEFVTAPDCYAEILAYDSLSNSEFIRKRVRAAEDKEVEASFASMERNIVAWNLTDRDGNPVPVTRDAIGRLHGPDFRAIAAAINARDATQAERTDEEKNASSAVSTAA